MTSSRILPAALLFAAFAATRLPAQYGVESNIPGAGFDPPPQPPTPAGLNRRQPATPTLHVYSRETILDVLVTDAAGHPVRGLKQSDFTVTEDGNPQSIRSFSETTASAPTHSPALPPNTYGNANNLPTNGPVQIIYAILPCPPAKGLQRFIGDYLRTMQAGTQVAVFGFRGDLGLRLVQGFTTDGPLAAAAAENISLPVCNPPSFDPIAAANQIAAYAAGVHGRKNLIWIGTPLDITRDGGLTWHPLPGLPPDMTLVHRLMDTYDRFTAEQIAIYPLDPQGVHIEHAYPSPILHAEQVAEDTGGAAIYNTNDFKSAIAKVVDDTSHYYTLSFVPPHLAEDGRYHPIKITTDRPGLHLTYRGGFNSEQPAPPDNVLKVHMSQASMGLGSLPATELLFNAKVEPSQPSDPQAGPAPARKSLVLAGKQPVTYNTLFTLQPDQITFRQSADGSVFNGAVEFDLAAYDSFGKTVSIRSQTLNLPLTAAEHADFESHPFQFFLPIDLPPGNFTLRLGVFDSTANRAGTLEIPISAIKPDPTPAVASAPSP